MNDFANAGAAMMFAVVIYFILVLAVWVVCAVAASELAAAKGRNQWFWGFVACFVISPFLAILALHCMTPLEYKLIASEKSQLCPYCISLVDARASRCPKCCSGISR